MGGILEDAVRAVPVVGNTVADFVEDLPTPEDIVRAVPIIGDPVADAADSLISSAEDVVRQIPLVGNPIADVVDEFADASGLGGLGGLGTPSEIATQQINTALTPQPDTQPAATEIPLPEAPVSRRRRAARIKQGRRGRSSTILTAVNNEPLGG